MYDALQVDANLNNFLTGLKLRQSPESSAEQLSAESHTETLEIRPNTDPGAALRQQSPPVPLAASAIAADPVPAPEGMFHHARIVLNDVV